MQNKIGLALFGALCYNLTQGLAFTLVRMQANALGDFRTLGLVVGLPNFALVGGSIFYFPNELRSFTENSNETLQKLNKDGGVIKISPSKGSCNAEDLTFYIDVPENFPEVTYAAAPNSSSVKCLEKTREIIDEDYHTVRKRQDGEYDPKP